jgi:hypothetical protein
VAALSSVPADSSWENATMPHYKEVGSGLTRRSQQFITVDEWLAGTALPTNDEEHAELWEQAIEVLRQANLPTSKRVYLVGPNGAWSNMTCGPLQLPDRKEDYVIHLGFWDGGAEEETLPWIAVQILTTIEQIQNALAENESELVRSFERRLGELKQLRFWKQYEQAAIAGLKREDFERELQISGARAQARTRNANLMQVVGIVRGLRPEQQRLSVSRLAGLVVRGLLNEDRSLGLSTVRRHLTSGRKRGLIPPED